MNVLIFQMVSPDGLVTQLLALPFVPPVSSRFII